MADEITSFPPPHNCQAWLPSLEDIENSTARTKKKRARTKFPPVTHGTIWHCVCGRYFTYDTSHILVAFVDITPGGEGLYKPIGPGRIYPRIR